MIGIDGVHCTIKFKKTAPAVSMIDRNLKNTDGSIYGNVRSHGEQIKLTINLPLMLRDTNVMPFGKNDFCHIAYIKLKLLTDINALFGEKVDKIIPHAIEVNTTKVLESATTCDCMKLFKLAYLEQNKQLMIWANKGVGLNYERTTGVLTSTKVNEYRVKVYDKTAQMLSEKNKLITPNTLRFELIFQGRRIRQTYGKDCDLFDVLNDPQKLIDLFNDRYQKEVKLRVKRYLKESRQIMFEALTQGIRPKDVFAMYRNLVVDGIQVESTLKMYYKWKGKQDQSKSISKALFKSLSIKSGIVYEIYHLND